jgi:hypothetical protein
MAIVGVGAAVWWVQFASDHTKAVIEETMSPVLGTLVSAWSWLLDGLAQLKDRITGESL